MKKNIFKFSVLTLAVLSLTACTLVPGQNLSTSNKDVIELPDNQYDLDKMVNIYPVTPGLIDQLRAKPIMSQANPELEQQIANGNDSNLLIVFYVQIMPDDFVMQLHRF